jgi:hypothetical protein
LLENIMPGKPVDDLALELQRMRAMLEETTDPTAVRLLSDIVMEMTADIKASESEGDGERGGGGIANDH